MPRFPIVPQRSRAPAAFSNSPRARAADFGGGLGDAVAAFGGEAGEFAQVVEERREREKRQAAREAKRVRDSAEAERLAEEAAAPEPAGEIAREQQRFQEKADRVAEEHRNHPLADQVKLQLEEQRQAWNRNLVAFEARQRVRQDLARADEIAQRWLTQVTDDPARFEEAAAYLFGDDGPVKGLGLRPEAQAAWEGRTFDRLLTTQMKSDPQRLISDLEAGRWSDRLTREQQTNWLVDAHDAAALRQRVQASEDRQRIAGEMLALQLSIAKGEAGMAEVGRAEREGRFSPEQIEGLKREAEQAEVRAQIARVAQDEYAIVLTRGVGFNAESPTHRKTAEDFYIATFREVVRAGADDNAQERIAGVVAKTGYLPKGLSQDLTAALLSDDPDRRVAAAQLYGRLLQVSSEPLEKSLDSEVRARGGALSRWLDAGLPPLEALKRAEAEWTDGGRVSFLGKDSLEMLIQDLGTRLSGRVAGSVFGDLRERLEEDYRGFLGRKLTVRDARAKTLGVLNRLILAGGRNAETPRGRRFESESVEVVADSQSVFAESIAGTSEKRDALISRRGEGHRLNGTDSKLYSTDDIFRLESGAATPEEYSAVKPRKGTYFYGGAGLNGSYIDDFIAALKESGFSDVYAGNRDQWTLADIIDEPAKTYSDDPDLGFILDASQGVMMLRDGEEELLPMGIQDYGVSGEQFNLIGYSYGALVAAQVAIKYARHFGGTVDHVVLLGGPISQSFLDELNSEPNIGEVIVLDLAEHDDPIYAGMTQFELLAALPQLSSQMSTAQGHFWYAGEDAEGQKRRRLLAEKLNGLGLR